MKKLLLSLLFSVAAFSQTGVFPPPVGGGGVVIAPSTPLNSACTVNNISYPLKTFNGTPYSCQGASGPLAGTYQTLPGSGGASSPATSGLLKGNGSANGIIPASATLDYVAPDVYTVGAGGVIASVLVTSDSSASSQVITPTTSACGFGVALSTQAAGTSVKVQTVGLAQIYADGVIPVGHVAICSASVGGYVTDSGFTSASSIPQTTHIIGVVTTASTGSSTLATVRLHGPGSYGTAPIVASVAGKTGPVSLVVGDVAGAQSASTPNTNNDAAGAAASALASANSASASAIAALNLGTASQHPATDFDATGAAAAAVAAIPTASSSTPGKISANDWNAFNNKQNPLGYAPLNPANNLSELTPATARTNLGLGSSATQPASAFDAAGAGASATAAVVKFQSTPNPSGTTCTVPSNSVPGSPNITYTGVNPPVTYACAGATPGGAGTYQTVLSTSPSGTLPLKATNTANVTALVACGTDVICPGSLAPNAVGGSISSPFTNGRPQVSGFVSSLYPGIGQSQLAWSAGSYLNCQAVSYSGGNYIAVSATNNGITPGTNSSVWYPVQNANTPTQLDCAWYQTQAYSLSSNSIPQLEIGSGNYNTCIGLTEPLSQNGVSLSGTASPSYVASNVATGTTVTASCSMTWMLFHGDNLTATGYTNGLHFEKLFFQGNMLAGGCLSLSSVAQGWAVHLRCEKAIGTKAWMEFGDDSGATGVVVGDQNFFEDDLQTDARPIPVAVWASVTAQATGNGSYTVNSSGNYTWAGVSAYLYGLSSTGKATNPCTTMGTLTVAQNGSNAVTAVSGSGFSGCSGTLYVSIPDNPPAAYGIYNYFTTDTTMKDLYSDGVGQIAAIFGGSNSHFIHPHAQQTPIGFYSIGNSKWDFPEIDSVTHYGYYVLSANTTIHGASWTWNGSYPGSQGYYLGPGATNLNITASSCETLQNAGAYAQFVNSSGTISHFSNQSAYPSGASIFAAQECVTGGYLVSTLSSSINATYFEGPIAGSETVGYSATPTFSIILPSSIMTSLTGNVTSFTIASGQDGQNKNITFCQDATGGRTVAPPANVANFAPLNPTSSFCTSESFVYSVGQGKWYTQGTSGGQFTVNSIALTGYQSSSIATIASAATIAPTTPYIFVTGTTAIATMTPPTGCTTSGTDCAVTLIADPATGPFTITTAGNFQLAFSPAAGAKIQFIYNPASSKWF